MELTQFYETEFAKNWEMNPQQKDSRLVSAVESTSFRGKRKSFNKLDVGTMTEVTERKGDTPDGDSTGTKYWIYRRKFEFVKVWDEDDEVQLGSVILPASDEINSFASAEARTKDDVIIAAFDASRYIGENGTDADAFDTDFDVAVNYAIGTPANSGLTVAKVLRAKKLLDEAEIPDENRFFAVSAQQIQNMLLNAEMVNSDYVGQLTPLRDGRVDQFAGFTFKRTERLTRNTSTDVRTCFAWHKSGVRFAELGRNVHIDVRTDKRHAKQLRGVARMGAVRTDNSSVVRVYADESP